MVAAVTIIKSVMPLKLHIQSVGTVERKCTDEEHIDRGSSVSRVVEL